MQSPHENYFNIILAKQRKVKSHEEMTIIQTPVMIDSFAVSGDINT